MKKSTKIALGASAFAVAAGAAIVTPIALSAWGDNSGGRDVYKLVDGHLYNTKDNSPYDENLITFNSITNNPNIGDERNFVGAREDTGVNAGINNTWNANEINVENGKTYLVRIYTHNNNANGTEATAHNVTNRFDISTAPGKSVEVRGYINADNAQPTQYWDNVIFKSDNTFHLEYVKGSAHFENNGVGKGGTGGAQLSDAITTSGVKIGYNALDGNIPGCFEYAGYTTIKVKVVYDHEYTVEKKVRKAGSTNKADWTDLLTANIGDEVEYQITYDNTSKSTTQAVTVKDILPNNVEYIKGSTVLYDALYPKGLKIDQDSLTTKGLNIGNYTAGSNAVVRFRGKVVDKNLACGKNEITNWAQVGVEKNTKQDAAKLMVTKTCDNPTPDNPGTTTVTSDNSLPGSMPNTGAGTLVAGSVIGAGALATSAGYYIASRKSLR